MNINAQSLVPKIDELHTVHNQLGADIICITETWLKEHVPSKVILLNGFHNPVRRDRTEIIGGGVCCYIRSNFQYKTWEELCEPNLETIWITIRPRKLPREFSLITIGVIYMPPGSQTHPRQEKEMICHIIKSMDFISSKHPQTGFFVVGDFNRMKDARLKHYPLK